LTSCNVGQGLFTQSRILKQPADTAVPKCINYWLYHAFEPFFTADTRYIPILWPMQTAQSAVNLYIYSGIIVCHVVIRSILCITFI